MEDGLGHLTAKSRSPHLTVLILVLMEYGLGYLFGSQGQRIDTSLNPCFNGIWSRMDIWKAIAGKKLS